MSIRSISLAFTAGIAAFLLVGVVVTELARPWIEFSLFVGVPAGIIAGAIVTTAVYLGLADTATPQRRRVAGSFVAFGVGFLVPLVVLAGIAGLGSTVALFSAVVTAVVSAAVVYLAGSRGQTGGAGGSGDATTNPK